MLSRRALLLVAIGACGSEPASPPDAAIAMVDAALPDAPVGFGSLSGMCGVLDEMDLTSAAPQLVRATFDFAREYDDATDRALLTAGGRRLAETPNAGGSSELSEIFAFEQLARCELALLLKTETEIEYLGPGKKTDMIVTIDDETIGVSVTRAQTFPLGTPYELSAATSFLTGKLDDVRLSTANVAKVDQWRKQILAILAWDMQAADTFAQAWAAIPDDSRADTIVVLTTTDGADTFIYTNQ